MIPGMEGIMGFDRRAVYDQGEPPTNAGVATKNDVDRAFLTGQPNR
jgi:hypothetical protein